MRPKHKLMLCCVTALMALPVAAGNFRRRTEVSFAQYQVARRGHPPPAQRVRVWIHARSG